MTLGSDILSKFSCQVLKSVYNLITLRPLVYAMLEQTRVGRIPHEIAGDLLNRARCNDPCGSRCFHGELCVGYSAVLKLVVHPFARSGGKQTSTAETSQASVWRMKVGTQCHSPFFFCCHYRFRRNPFCFRSSACPRETNLVKFCHHLVCFQWLTSVKQI